MAIDDIIQIVIWGAVILAAIGGAIRNAAAKRGGKAVGKAISADLEALAARRRAELQTRAARKPVQTRPASRARQQQAQQRQRAQAMAKKRQQQQLARQKAQSRAQPPRKKQFTSRIERIAEPHEPIDAGESVVHRHVPDATPVPGRPTSDLATVIGKLDRASLRRAVILKEILDPPIALRDQA